MKDMKALLKRRPEPGLWFEEIPVPEPGIRDVLIRVLITGIADRSSYLRMG
jgi:threonine 3-dehydrogenase